ncbi:MAG TPA: Spx/MgsR family RNA polymerase-binding regulatory protein [Thermomicrobiales bacterium]|nr:Spx/MgsR family RNA polymerase-binding regulatory protein [Thermomicrobiales bacterium]
MKPILYLYRSCTSCRNAASILDAHGVDYDVREYFKEPFTREELESVLERAGQKPSDLVAARSVPYRAQGLAERGLSEDELLERMLAEPRLVRRPILVTEDEVAIGFDRDRYEQKAKTLASRVSADA